MAKARAKAKFEILDTIKTIFDPRTSKLIGNVVVKGIKDATKRGRSPVKGFGRYEAYAVQRDDAVGNYPRGIAGKNRRPVNLRLSEDMMNSLSFRKTDKDSVKIGILSENSDEILIRANVHNDGAPDKNIPQRKFIANKTGDEYSLTIQRAIRRVFELRLNNLIKRSNRRR